MKFGLIIPSWNEERALKTAENLAKGSSLSLVIISGAKRTEQRWGAVKSMAQGARKLLIKVPDTDILVFTHDDVEIYEPWTEYLDLLFTARPSIGLIGLHGSTGLGSEDIYRTRYELQQLARFDPASNMVNAEEHGRRITVPTKVATIDGFFMAVRTSAYLEIGGWEACLKDGIPYHMYDHWMAMVLREHEYSTYLAPVSCRHFGGGTEVGMADKYEEWAKENGFNDGSDVHTQGHIAFYQRFRGQLPIRVR